MAEVLELFDTVKVILMKLSEGNPGALSVLTKILENDHPDRIFIFSNLDSLGIRGQKIWIGYKDYCNQDLNAFCDLVNLGNEDMINFINKEMGIE